MVPVKAHRRRRGFVRAVALLLSVALVSACTVSVREPTGGKVKGNETIRVAVVPKAIGFDFWEQVRLGADCAAGKHSNVNLHWDGVTSESDVSGQQSLLQDLLAQGVDGLVYAATDAKALSDVSKIAVKQGTTVVNIDSGTKPQPPQVPLYATDNVTAAEHGADFMADQLGGEGSVALVEFQPGTATNDTRVKGFKKGLKEHSGLDLVAQQSSTSDYNKALQVTQDILTANPDLDGIYAANEPSVLGAAEAVRQAGKAGKVKIIGWDTSAGEIKAVRQGVVSGLIAQNPFRMGYASVDSTVDKVRGHRSTLSGDDTGSQLITKRNLGTKKVQRLLHPSCARPPR